MTTESSIVAQLRLAANAEPPWDGRGQVSSRCRALSYLTGTVLLYSRDCGMHSSGWFKNPDYERCYHLSISGFDPISRERRIVTRREAEHWARAFFETNAVLTWCEPAATQRGRALGVVHYRLFCDVNWQPIHPRGEVYSTEFTERGWRSWSDRHGAAPEPSVLHAG